METNCIRDALLGKLLGLHAVQEGDEGFPDVKGKYWKNVRKDENRRRVRLYHV